MRKGSCYIEDENGVLYPVSKEDKQYLKQAFAKYCVGEHVYSKQWIIEKLRKWGEKLPLVESGHPNIIIVPCNGPNIVGNISFDDLHLDKIKLQDKIKETQKKLKRA